MAQGATHFSKFGNWDREGNTPHTEAFDNAHTGRSCVGGNLNDPAEDPTAFTETVRKIDHVIPQSPNNIPNLEDSGPSVRQSSYPPRKTHVSEVSDVHVTKPQHERRASREDTEFVQHVESPSPYRYAESPAQRTVGESPGHRYSGRSKTTGGGSLRPNIGDLQRRGAHAHRDNGGSERGVGEHHHQGQNQSPLHHHYQGRLGNKPGAANSGWERKISTDGGTTFAPATPVRSKVRGSSTRADETPDRSAPLPKFGEWNEKDPTSADDFSYIFNKRREEKQTGGTVMVAAVPPGTPSYVSNHKQANASQYKSLGPLPNKRMDPTLKAKPLIFRESTTRAIKPINANTRAEKTDSHWDGVAWHQGQLNDYPMFIINISDRLTE